jgi:peptidoglycan/xylan/chitin deacetylase (PgdA/CDA1 family)
MLQQVSKAGRLFRATCSLFALFLIITGGCATPPTPAPPAVISPAKQPPPTDRERRSPEYVVITAIKTDTYESLARHYLGDGSLSYIISEYNKDVPISAGRTIVIPLQPVNPGGIYTDGYQTVPVLCYHRFSTKKSSDKITVSAETFERQMAYLKNYGYTVLTLKQFEAFIEYRQRPPRKSVLITIDDGWKTAQTIAYPILKKYGFPSVLFVNTHNIKEKQNTKSLTWEELREMKATGLIDIESHSVTHDDLTRISDEQLKRELEESKRLIKTMLGTTTNAIAYPYGMFNSKTIDVMKQVGYKYGFTVIRGGNAFFFNPYALNRSMIYNSEKMEDFIKSLQTFRQD